jgi:hypothetical protein
MKKLFYFIFFIVLFGVGNTSCDLDCNADYWQICIKNDLGNGQCHFEVRPFRDCPVWRDREYLKFNDSCSVYSMSQTISYTELHSKYGVSI